MNPTQAKLLDLSRNINLYEYSLREIARRAGAKNPETIKYHMKKLEEQGLINVNAAQTSRIDDRRLGDSQLISIPILGSASAGPATQLADSRVQGHLKVSSRLLDTTNYRHLYALRVSGSSMNMANIKGKPADDGDFVIVDSSRKSPRENDHVIAVVDNLANIKRFHLDKVNNQIVLLSDSSEDYTPIFVHPEDERDGLISGVVIQVIKMPPHKRQLPSN